MRRSALFVALAVALSSLLGLVSSPAYAASPAAPKVSVAKVFAGQEFALSGKIGTPFTRSVSLVYVSGSTWKSAATATTAADGSYTFKTSTTATSRKYRVVAAKTQSNPALTSASTVVKTAVDAVSLVLTRNASSGVAIGRVATETPGRQWALQAKSGSKWTQVGTKVAEDKGIVTADFPADTSTSYRLVGDAIPGSTGVTSNALKAAKGPSKLGPHVIYATTDNGKIPKKKGVDYTGSLSIDKGKSLPLDDIAVRGNTSATYPKQPYKIKFSDSQNPLGLPKGKSFILLGNYQDHSLLRTAVGIGYVAAQLHGLEWTPHRAFAELYINGKYLGSYEIIESIKIQPQTKKNDARIPADEETGVSIEINPSTHKGTPGIFKGKHGMYYGFKDPDQADTLKDGSPDPEGVTKAKTAKMKTRILKFEKVLYGKNYRDPNVGWTHYLDMKSAVDFYLENEFIKNWDGDFYRSTFFYTKDYRFTDSKLFMGPIWDVDRSARSKTSGSGSIQSAKGWWMNGDGGGHTHNSDNVHTKHWFVQITKDPAFQKAIRARWAQTSGIFKSASTTGVTNAENELSTQAAANDRALWQKSNPTGRYGPRAKTYAGEVSFLRKYYKDRYTWMNGQLT